MSYIRVIPRDLFNEADLLKCWGKLWIALEKLGMRDVAITHDDAAFVVVQDQSDGSISLENVRLQVRGAEMGVRRPLNSRAPWPLFVINGEDEIRVFDTDGSLSKAFIDFLTYPKNERGEMELTMEQYAATTVWPCCNKAICTCGKARHPAPIREMIAEAAADPITEADEIEFGLLRRA